MQVHALLLRVTAAVLVGGLLTTSACENTEEPQPPTRIMILSGNQQNSKVGTPLPEPLRVMVQFADLTEAPNVAVRFRALSGGGSASPGSDVTDGYGIAEVEFTLGATLGTQTIRAELVDDNTRYVDFTATGAEYFCPEEDPAYSYKFVSQGTIQRDLFLFTRFSSLNESNGVPVAGLVQLAVEGGTLRPTSFTKFEETTSRLVPHDASFSQAGDLFLSRLDLFPELLKVKPNRSSFPFTVLESYEGAEITRATAGILVGCDQYGPFVSGCRDTVQRFDEASYDGSPNDRAHYNAVTVDTNPANAWYEDIYFVYVPDRTLRRLPLDERVPEGSSEIVAQLTRDEAEGAGGMVCDDDGTVYMLVETSETKAILRVTPQGTKTVEYDFFNRGAGNAAGVQSDLAIQPGIDFLYTIDTWNNMLLVYDVGQQTLSEMFPDTLSGYDAEAISTDFSSGERVGLAVLPGPSGF